jgi:putative transposase
MPNYRRWYRPGGTFFFTVVTHLRRPILCEDIARPILRAAIEQCLERHAFTIEAMVLFPDHFHPLIRLPDGVITIAASGRSASGSIASAEPRTSRNT